MVIEKKLRRSFLNFHTPCTLKVQGALHTETGIAGYMHIEFGISGGYVNINLAYHGDTEKLPPDVASKLLGLIESSRVLEI